MLFKLLTCKVGKGTAVPPIIKQGTMPVPARVNTLPFPVFSKMIYEV